MLLRNCNECSFSIPSRSTPAKQTAVEPRIHPDKAATGGGGGLYCVFYGVTARLYSPCNIR